MNTRTPTSEDAARGREVGSLIGGSFGMAFVGINSAGLASGTRIPLLVIAALALALIVVLALRSYRRNGRPAGTPAPSRGSGPPFGRKYWLVVAIEAVALFAGSRLLTGLGVPELGVAWVSFVVGTHFFALGAIFRLARFHLLAALVTVCGVAGFALFAAGASPAIAVVSGVVPGFLLLAFGLRALAPARVR